eukprot:746942-Pyramimonas_sp.AAC.1
METEMRPFRNPHGARITFVECVRIANYQQESAKTAVPLFVRLSEIAASSKKRESKKDIIIMRATDE